MHVQISDNPLAPSYDPGNLFGRGRRTGPVWISPRGPFEQPAVFAYRRRCSLPEAVIARVHVTADERYQLYLDGEQIGRGPERGDPGAWFYETFELTLSAGEHVLVARVWSLSELAPAAQMTASPGFLLLAEGALASALSTGVAEWEVKRLDGYSFFGPDTDPHAAWFVGPNQSVDAASYPWGVECGEGEGWEAVASRVEDVLTPFGVEPEHALKPGPLLPQMSASRRIGKVRFAGAGTWANPQMDLVPADAGDGDDRRAWQALVEGKAPVVVPANSSRQVVVDLEQYYCAYPAVVTSGGRGSSVTLAWTEALYVAPDRREKGQRDEVLGRYVGALTRDVFRPDGGASRRFETLWWRAGRYLEFLVETSDEPLTIESVSLEETRYPLEMESRFSTDDGRLDRVLPIALRGLQMCAHETYMDCPYYEQMMYVGDTRLEVLTTYAISSDDRLPRKALALFDHSRLPSGMTQARYPCRPLQVIPPFALWWVAMVHDFALWRSDRAFVVGLLPGVRAVLDGFLGLVGEDGVLPAPAGWNFEDWAAGWDAGNPPSATSQPSGLLNWHLVYTLGLAARLEEWTGEPELARRFERERQRLALGISSRFWDESRGLFADDTAHERFSEHTQCLALLSGALDDKRRARVGQGLLGDPDLTRTTIYFTHYLFEACRLLGRADLLFDRLGLWFDLPAQGFKTTPEAPEPSRSDCHGWGAHPIYHAFATILGIRPTDYGFDRLEIAPLLGPIQSAAGSLVHPRGRIEAHLEARDGRLRASVTLPEGATGTLRYGGASRDLRSGHQDIEV